MFHVCVYVASNGAMKTNGMESIAPNFNYFHLTDDKATSAQSLMIKNDRSSTMYEESFATFQQRYQKFI